MIIFLTGLFLKKTFRHIMVFFFLITFSLMQANPTQEDLRKECMELVEESLKDVNSKDYAGALEKLLRIELMADENKWGDILWAAKNQIGIIYMFVSDFAKASDYFQESYSLTQASKELYEMGASPLANIGLLYVNEKKYEEALNFYYKAYDIAKRGKDSVARKNIANNIADTYIKLGKGNKSLEILHEEEKPVNNVGVDFKWKVIYIKAISILGNLEQAEELAQKLYDELNLKEDFRDECFVCLVTTFSEIYADQNKFDMAIEYAKKGLAKDDELTTVIELYEQISELYYKKGEYQKAFQYKDSALITTDSLSAAINRSQYEINKTKFKVLEYQNELQAKKTELYTKTKQQKSERTLFIITAILSVTVAFLTHRALRNKVIKQKQEATIAALELEKEKREHQLTEKQLEANKLKRQQLKYEIAEKNRELSAKALYLSSRNKLIGDIIHTLETDSKETVKQVKTIKNFLKAENHQEDFVRHFEKVNPGLLKRLKETHPSLTANDIRFLSYVFMNLSIKEIGVIFNITYNASKKRKQRIMEKMNLDSENDSLYDYLLSV